MAKTSVQVPSTVEKWTSLTDLEKTDRGAVYVINGMKGEGMGYILINIPRKNGNGSDILRVPPTFIPIDATSQVTKQQLMDSTEFRQSVLKRIIRLVNPIYAEKVMQTAEAQAELQRVTEEMSRNRVAAASALLNGDEDHVATAMFQSDEEASTSLESLGSRDALSDKQRSRAATIERNKEEEQAAASGVKINPKFVLKVESALAEGMKGVQIVAMLRNQGTLTKADLQFARKKFSKKSVVVEFIDKALSKMKAKKAVA